MMNLRKALLLAAATVAAGIAPRAADVTIPGTVYSLSVPVGYTQDVVQNAPDILFQCSNAGGTSYVQVVKGAANADGPTAAGLYEQLMQQALPGFAMTAGSDVVVNGRKTHMRRYKANADGRDIHACAVFYSDDTTGFIIHLIDQTGTDKAAEGMLLSLKSPGAPAAPAAAGAGRTPVGNTGFYVTFPAGWNPQQAGQPNSLQMAAPGRVGLLELTYVADDSVGVTPEQLMQQAMDELQKGITGGGEWKSLEDSTRDFPGRKTRFRVFSGSIQNLPVEVAMLTQYAAKHLFVIYGLYPANARQTDGAAIKAAMYSITTDANAAVAAIPAAPLGVDDDQPGAGVAAPLGVDDDQPGAGVTVAVPAAARYTRVQAPGNLSFEVPDSYSGTAADIKLILTSGDAARAGLAFVAQKMERTPGGPHADLATSVETALTQLRGAPSAKLLANRDVTVAGSPGKWLELTFEAQDGVRRMAQVLVADTEAVYWLGFNGPVEAFNRFADDLKHAAESARLAGTAAAAVTTPPPGTAGPTLQPFHLTTGDLTIPFPEGWTSDKGPSVITFHGPEGTPDSATTLNLQGLDKATPQNRDFPTALATFTNGFRGAGADISVSKPIRVGEIDGHLIEATAVANGVAHRFRYLLLDRPGIVVAVSFVAPEDQWAAYAPLVDRMIAGIAPKNTTPAPAPRAAGPAPKTARDTYLALAGAIAAKDWDTAAALTHPDSLKQGVDGYLGEMAAEAGIAGKIANLPPRQAWAVIMREVPKAAEDRAFLGRKGEVFEVMEHKDDMHLVKVKYGNSARDQQYFWMHRIDGAWCWKY